MDVEGMALVGGQALKAAGDLGSHCWSLGEANVAGGVVYWGVGLHAADGVGGEKDGLDHGVEFVQ